jgi:hypothetical protein
MYHPPHVIWAREKRSGGRQAPAHDEWDSLVGRSRLSIFVHGFNNSEARAEDIWKKTHGLLVSGPRPVRADELDPLTLYFWPGDMFVSGRLGAIAYFAKVKRATECGEDLAMFLVAHAARLGRPLTVQFVGHSLGCRLVLEVLRTLDGQPGVIVNEVLLMAAAVPEGLCDKGSTYERPSTAMSRKDIALWSRNDEVLEGAFRKGQWMARRFRGEPSPGNGPNATEAVGFTGGPSGRWTSDVNSGLRHGDYWSTRSSVDQIATLFTSFRRPERPAQHPALRRLPDIGAGERRKIARWRD